MNWLDFTASIAKSLASLGWPASFAWAVWIFRKELINLLPRLHFKKGEFEAYFDQRLELAEKEAKIIINEADKGQKNKLESGELPRVLGSDRKYDAIAKLSPRAAILEMRANLEQSVRDLAKAVDFLGHDKKSIVQIIKELRSRNLIGEHHYSILESLRTLGNSAAHNDYFYLSEAEAIRYGELTDFAIAEINGLTAIF